MTVTIIHKHNKRPEADKSLRTLMLIYNSFVKVRPFCIVQPNGGKRAYNRDEMKKLGPEYDKAASEAVVGGTGCTFLRAK